MRAAMLAMIAGSQCGGKGVDNTPDQFTFTDQTLVAPSTTITSNTITLTGMDVGSSAAVSVVGGTYSKNGGAYTSSAGTATNGDTFSVQQTSSASTATAVNTTLTVGTISDTFTSTTYTSVGPELWPQPAFDASTGLTLLRCSVTGGQLVSDASGNPASATVTLAGGSINAGDRFQWSFDIASNPGVDGIRLFIGGSLTAIVTAVGTYSGTVTSPGSSQALQLQLVDNFGVDKIDNVSIKKLS